MEDTVSSHVSHLGTVHIEEALSQTLHVVSLVLVVALFAFVWRHILSLIRHESLVLSNVQCHQGRRIHYC